MFTQNLHFLTNTLYFCSNRPGGSGGLDLWQASINPVVDLNADRIIDSADMCIIVDQRQTLNQVLKVEKGK
jgi:hypothetical protein